MTDKRHMLPQTTLTAQSIHSYTIMIEVDFPREALDLTCPIIAYFPVFLKL